MLYTKYQFRDLMSAGAADIVQPDLLLCGGLLEAKKIAALAEANYVTVAPHNPLGPVSTAVAAQFAVSTPNFCILNIASTVTAPHAISSLSRSSSRTATWRCPTLPAWESN